MLLRDPFLAHLDCGWQTDIFNPHQAEDEGDDGQCDQQPEEGSGEELLVNKHLRKAPANPNRGTRGVGGHGWLEAALVSKSCKESILKSSPEADAITGKKVLSG